MPTIEHTLHSLVERFQSMGPERDPLVAAHLNVLGQTLDVIKAKSNGVMYDAA
jgi:hypothetical protein